MIFGYSRVSTVNQKDNFSLKHQKDELLSSGCEKIYTDVFTGSKINRKGLNQLLSEIKSGDTLICTKLDRLSRNLVEGITLIQDLTDRNITVKINNIGIIDTSSTGKLLLSILLSFSQFERDIIRERMIEGKITSNHWGGKTRISKSKTDLGLELLKTHSYREVERMTGISVSTLQRRMKEKQLENQKC